MTSPRPLLFSLLFLLTFLSACGIYNSDFDCPAGRGIGCAPAGEVLDRIIEEDEGEVCEYACMGVLSGHS